MIDVVELLQHWHVQRPIGELCSSLGMDPKTVRKYTAPALAAGICPGGAQDHRSVDVVPHGCRCSSGARWWTSGSPTWWTARCARRPGRRSRTTRRASRPAWLGEVTESTIHQRLRDDHGLSASESSLRRYIRANFAEEWEATHESVVVLRDTPPAGDEAQVDYGLLGRWRDPATDRIRRVWGFLMVLAFSRMMFLRPVLSMDEASWVHCHVRAFLGAGVRRVVPDNLKTGVIKVDLYDPLINRAYAEFARHYGCLIDPARRAKPRDKARVERPVPYARDSFFAKRSEEFTTLVAMQADALRWCAEVANVRAHRGNDRQAPQTLYDAEERPAMLSLPVVGFELARWSAPKVGTDIHAKVGKALYSVPWRLIGEVVGAREGTKAVEIYHDGALVTTHVRIESGRQTNYDHYPPEKVAFMMRTPAWCRRRAGELGASVAAVVESLMEVNALYRLRQCQGVIGLADKYGAERLEAAYAKALAGGDPAYRTIKNMLAAGLEADEAEQAQRAPSAPAHLHGPEGLFEELAR